MNNCSVCSKPLILGKIVRKEFCRPCYYKGKSLGTIQKIVLPELPSKLSLLQEEFLIGSILGDGSLVKHKGSQNVYFEIGRSKIDEEYLLQEHYLFKDFCKGNLRDGLYEKTFANKISGTISNIIGFKTRANTIFTSSYKDWYEDGKKKVNVNLKLTPQIIAVWLADDGCVSIHPQAKSYRLRLNFATNSFSLDEVNFLIFLLNERYNEKFRLSKREKNNKVSYMIEAADAATRALVKDIDNYFPTSMIRKSNVWRNIESKLYDHNYRIYKARK